MAFATARGNAPVVEKRSREMLKPFEGIVNGPEFELGSRAKGWLRYLYRKSLIKDDWSINGSPHECWDKSTQAPMLSFPRFDCSESSYFLLLAADKLPAWREVFTGILSRLLVRHTSFWGSVDFLTQFAHDPKAKRGYPFFIKGLLVPKDKPGYDTPGWTGHGVPNPCNNVPSQLMRDAVDAPAMLFFKGWLSLLTGILARVSGDGNPGMELAGLDDTRRELDYKELCRKLHSQFSGNGGAGLN